MKTRTGLVSNSSTSSFICDVCNRVEAGMDLSISDAEMIEFYPCCHIVHINCLSEDLRKKIFEDEGSSSEKDNKNCPFCNFEKLCNDDFIRFLEMKTPDIRNVVMNEIKTTYITHANFCEALKKDADKKRLSKQ